ncbi:c47f6bbb-3b04-4231-be71-9cd71164d082-CDS [Sclerotinia trifoliorum]|uniref:C47f6bbb-3b04-4231-be71-9cd71164d082-CDS n=1 Tax=Sclerotinia trifoliorum TaxID=28548 RepID=A0A8H2VW43_9HELO|nr:c47f6bbb-3b04-4231-be71-9cd71164d082-CDS [Sclerotinia trifoliorum]
MGQATLIISLVIIVITLIGGSVAFFVWHWLHRSRPVNEGIQMLPIRERSPHARESDADDRRVWERDQEGGHIQDHDAGGLSLADIVRGIPGRHIEGTGENEGRSLADIVNPPPKRRGKSSTAHLKKGKIQNTTDESQANPSTTGAGSSSSNRVRRAPMRAEESVSGLGGKEKGKRAPGKIHESSVTPDNSNIPLIGIDSSPSSQDERSLKSAS